MSNTTPNPLARLVLEARQIITKAAQPGQNKAVAIERLAKLLCKPVAHEALIEACGADAVRDAVASLG